MKTRLNYLFLLAIIFLTPNLVYAASACSYEEQAELNNIVANVKATYEVVDVYTGKAYDVDNPNEDGTFPEVDHFIKAFNINILNITEDIYVKVTNNYNSDEKTYTYKDTNNGIVTMQTKNVEQLVTYSIEVYSNKYACIGEKFRVLYMTTPIFNAYSARPACENNKGFYYCQEFIPSENISYNEFLNKLEEYEKQKDNQVQEDKTSSENKSFIERIKGFYNINRVIINIALSAIVVAGVATTVVLVKKKRSRVL